MSYASNISAYRTELGKTTTDSRSQHQTVVTSNKGLSKFGKGESYDAFNKKFGGIDKEINAMHNSLDKTSSALKKLKDALDRADNEDTQ